MSVNFIPNRHLLVVRLDPTHNQLKTESGIEIIQKNRADSLRGTVIAAGSGTIHPKTGEVIPFVVKVGDTVLVCQGAGRHIEVDGEKLLAIIEEDIMLILDRKNDQ